ncbi:hypothetical protein [Teredinibacter turnerae]|uniref:hypothetical protein n=1 Tax=Teredinibacter turnerae TaxID=2426 RepID=UPI00039B8776|nr:hypothetical protein [Teredinibacter turnerae]
MVKLAFVVTVMLLCGCAQHPAQSPADTTPKVAATPCPSARPQMCMMIYDPVCAIHEDGSHSTEGNNCSACQKEAITAYTSGPCPEAAD